MTTKIIIYKTTKKPAWLKIGVHVHCLGEGLTKFTVEQIDVKGGRALLHRSYGSCWEPITKLQRAC
jgi:hypothetical protein